MVIIEVWNRGKRALTQRWRQTTGRHPNPILQQCSVCDHHRGECVGFQLLILQRCHFTWGHSRTHWTSCGCTHRGPPARASRPRLCNTWEGRWPPGKWPGGDKGCHQLRRINVSSIISINSQATEIYLQHLKALTVHLFNNKTDCLKLLVSFSLQTFLFFDLCSICSTKRNPKKLSREKIENNQIILKL